MLDPLSDAQADPYDSQELPPAWRSLLESLQDGLTRAENERDHLSRALARTSTELREQLIELEALRRARRSAESGRLVRGQMLALVGQSMRAPADAVLGLTELLRLGALAPAQRAYADALREAAETLKRTLNDVSDFSRLESGTLPLEPIAFDLSLLVEDLAGSFGARLRRTGVRLRVHWESSVPRRVTGDPGRIRQILTSLVEDALARLSTGEIAMTVGGAPGPPASSSVHIVVEDTGPAIPADLLNTIFEPFLPLESYVDPAAGLALPIARQLAHLMGGELSVTNSSGSGTRFGLNLPLAPARQAEPVDPAEAADLPSEHSSGTRLLVVEADASLRGLWIEVARAAGFDALGCEDRTTAERELRRCARERHPCAVVLFSDHDAEGYEKFGHEICEDPLLGKPALLMLPAVGNPGDARRLRDAGFRGYLVKPVAPADLRETLEVLRRTPRLQWHRVFLTRHALAEARAGVALESSTPHSGDRES